MRANEIVYIHSFGLSVIHDRTTRIELILRRLIKYTHASYRLVFIKYRF